MSYYPFLYVPNPPVIRNANRKNDNIPDITGDMFLLSRNRISGIVISAYTIKIDIGTILPYLSDRFCSGSKMKLNIFFIYFFISRICQFEHIYHNQLLLSLHTSCLDNYPDLV